MFQYLIILANGQYKKFRASRYEDALKEAYRQYPDGGFELAVII